MYMRKQGRALAGQSIVERVERGAARGGGGGSLDHHRDHQPTERLQPDHHTHQPGVTLEESAAVLGGDCLRAAWKAVSWPRRQLGTQGKGSVLAWKAVRTHRANAVSLPRRQRQHNATAVSLPRRQRQRKAKAVPHRPVFGQPEDGGQREGAQRELQERAGEGDSEVIRATGAKDSPYLRGGLPAGSSQRPRPPGPAKPKCVNAGHDMGIGNRYGTRCSHPARRQV